MSMFKALSGTVVSLANAGAKCGSALEHTAGIADNWAIYGEDKAKLSIDLARLRGRGEYAQTEAEIREEFPELK